MLRLKIGYCRCANGGLIFVYTQRVPVYLQFHLAGGIGPTGNRQQCKTFLFIHGNEYFVVVCFYRAMAAPVANHLAALHAHFVPKFPYWLRIALIAPSKPACHTIYHAPPGVAISLQHFTHQSKRNTAYFC